MRKLIFALVAFAPALAFALSLDEAKSKGFVGERPDGYLGVVQDGPGVTDLVRSINNQRRDAYQKTASGNGTSLSAVEALAAQKAYEMTKPGHFVQGANGSWMKK